MQGYKIGPKLFKPQKRKFLKANLHIFIWLNALTLLNLQRKRSDRKILFSRN